MLFTEDVSPRRSGAIHLAGGSPGRRETTFFAFVGIWQVVDFPVLFVYLP